jgi:hypothetical protein
VAGVSNYVDDAPLRGRRWEGSFLYRPDAGILGFDNELYMGSKLTQLLFSASCPASTAVAVG